MQYFKYAIACCIGMLFMMSSYASVSHKVIATDRCIIGMVDEPSRMSGEKSSNIPKLWSNIIPLLKRSVGLSCSVVYYRNFEMLEAQLQNQNIDFAYSQWETSPAIILNKIPGARVVVLNDTEDFFTRDLKPTYTAYLATRVGSDTEVSSLNQLNKLNGKKIIFGTNPKDRSWGLSFFKAHLKTFVPIESDMHYKAVQEVLSGAADATISPDRSFQHLSAQQLSQLRIIPAIEYSNGGVFSRAEIAPGMYKKMQQGLLDVDGKEDKGIFDGQHIQGFALPFDAKHYHLYFTWVDEQTQ